MSGATSGTEAMAVRSQPNIVLIMTDQQRADFFKSEGFALDTMPFVDSLSAQGVRFANAYTTMPDCAPA
ncbi:MAG TPA: sulfatase-like hydrolase/transferase, partial [Thermomicrobiales bacterium]|nr:sulfatase-like hydrolase/transferase [Thermomicrobiales bacterium]